MATSGDPANSSVTLPPPDPDTPTMSSGRATVASGGAMVEMVVVLALLLILLQLVSPSFVHWRARQQLRGTVQSLGSTVRRLQAAAEASGRAHGLALASDAGNLNWQLVVDGDGDGLRRTDLAAGVDLPLEPARVLRFVYPDVHPGRPAGVPPLSGGSPGIGGVAFGRASLLTCSPDGGSSAGTLYLHDRHGDGAALRMYGPTGRVTLWWWEAGEGGWTLLR
ncbi:MAG: hypothetical protein ACE5HV_09135 [Acidobacteriota bacterium]